MADQTNQTPDNGNNTPDNGNGKLDPNIKFAVQAFERVIIHFINSTRLVLFIYGFGWFLDANFEHPLMEKFVTPIAVLVTGIGTYLMTDSFKKNDE